MSERTGTDQALELQVKRQDDFGRVLQALHDRRYTGSFTVHCHQGLPRTVEFPGVQISLTSGTVLDKEPPTS